MTIERFVPPAPETHHTDDGFERNVYTCPECGRYVWAYIGDDTVDVCHFRDDDPSFHFTQVSRYAWSVYCAKHMLTMVCRSIYQSRTGSERNGQDGDPGFIKATQLGMFKRGKQFARTS